MLLLLSLFLFFWRLGDLNLFGMEPLRALPAQAMLDTRDWFVPHLNGKPYLMKPPLMYWLIALVSMPHAKVTEISARLPSALSATMLVLLLYWFARRYIGSLAGFLCGLITLASGLIFEKAVIADIEMSLSLMVTASLLLLYMALERKEKNFAYTLGAYFFLSMAFLSKGPPALIFFISTLLVFLVWEKRLKFLWSPSNLLSFFLFVVIAVSWVTIVIHKVGWTELIRGGAGEFSSRISRGTPFHLKDLLFYPIGILGAFFPWSLFLPLAFLPSYYRSLGPQQKHLHRFLYCGIAANIVLFSLVAGKENRYLIPIYPLMVVIMGGWWARAFENSFVGRSEWYLKNVSTMLFAVFSFAAILIVIQPVFHVPTFHIAAPLCLALTAISIAGLVFSRHANYRAVFACIILFFVVAKFIHTFGYIPARNARYAIESTAEEMNTQMSPGRTVYTVSYNKPNIFFYFKNPVIALDDVSAFYKKAANGAHFYGMLTEDEIAQLKEHYGVNPSALYEFDSNKHHVYLISSDAVNMR